MKGHNEEKRAQGTESGYALILMMFFLALLALSMAVASPTVSNSIRREKETEMIWRGKQYARGIRLYYAKMKRLPGSLDDLTKPSDAGVRFMRQAYKDPMNQVDGSWRLIYMGPKGQLIGSVSGLGGAGLGAPVIGGAQVGGSSLLPSSFDRGPANAGIGSNATTPFSTSNASINQSPTDYSGQPQTLAGPMDGNNTIGGNIVGVGSKVNRKSLIVYHGNSNYENFEFIFEQSTVGIAPAAIGTAVQNSNGVSPANGGTPTAPAANPGNSINQTSPGLEILPQGSPLPASPQN
jgi:type II secretory pathway pseudopilin PulG